VSATIAPVPTDALFEVFVDLGGRKLWPAPHHMAAGGQLHAPVISVAASDWDDPPLTPPRHTADAVTAALPDADPAARPR
jgi:hypothetical protein